MDGACRWSNGQRGLVIPDRFPMLSLATKGATQGEISPEIAGMRLLNPLQKRDRVSSDRAELICES
jgi:hypothetical protein